MPEEQQTQQPQEAPSAVRQEVTHTIGSVNLTDPDENGMRVMDIVTSAPPIFGQVVYKLVLNEPLADYLKERLNAGIVTAKPADIAAVASSKGAA